MRKNMTSDRSVTVLISGRGSNLKALIEKAQGYRITAVLSNSADAGGLEIAREHGIPTRIVLRADYPTLSDFKLGVLCAVRDTNPDIVALAGFMMVLPPAFIEAFPERIVNIHPSLLPKYPGLDTHTRALQASETQHGCTVHLVDAGIDTGIIVAQRSVEVLASDDPDTLSARVLSVEHKLYPWTLSMIARGEIGFAGGEITYSPRATTEALEWGFELMKPRSTGER
jgi:phosphoribosylglycinamide formyltransferase-1